LPPPIPHRQSHTAATVTSIGHRRSHEPVVLQSPSLTPHTTRTTHTHAHTMHTPGRGQAPMPPPAQRQPMHTHALPRPLELVRGRRVLFSARSTCMSVDVRAHTNTSAARALLIRAIPLAHRATSLTARKMCPLGRWRPVPHGHLRARVPTRAARAPRPRRIAQYHLHVRAHTIRHARPA
jgi:hypothetical protein